VSEVNYTTKKNVVFQRVSRLGAIPEDWNYSNLSDICKLITDGTHYSPSSTNGPRKYITSRNVRPGYLDLSEVAYISEDEHNSIYKSCPVKFGDVLLTKDGANAGNACLNPLQEEFSLLSSVALIRVNREIINNYFLLYFILSPRGQYSIGDSVAGQAITRITLTAIREYLVPLPPLPEQRKIARILGAWDRALADLDALIEAKRRRKRGLAQRLLTGRVRLRGFGCAEMVETKIGTVPSDWREVRFGKVFKRQSEKNESSAIKRVITVGKYAIRPQSEHFDKSVASADLSNYNVIRPGDFVYDPMSAYYGAIGRYDYEEPGIVSPVYRVLKLRRGFDSGFIKHLLKAHYVRHRIASYSTQGNKEGKRRGLQHVAFKAIPIFVPTEEEQRRIAGVLDAADAELAALDAQRDALAHQKRGLMQRLLTGEVRVTPDNEDYHIAESECNA